MEKGIERAWHKLRASLTRNLPWKIVAFLLAFALWFFVLNIIDPVRNVTETVFLVLRNEEALAEGLSHIHLENINELRNTRIEIQVRGNSRTLEEIRANLVAYIDLSTSDIRHSAQNAGVVTTVVHIEGVQGAELLGRRPASVQLQLDTIVTRYFDVVVNVQGEVDEDFFMRADEIEVYPTRLPITGPSSVVGNVDRLVLNVNVAELTGTYSVAEQITSPVNIVGSPVHSHHLSNFGRVHVVVPVYRRGLVAVAAPAASSPPPGFGIYNIDWYPRFFAVAGDEAAIADLVAIQLSPVESIGVEHFRRTYNILNYLPEGVFLIEPENFAVFVDVAVEPLLVRHFNIGRADFQTVGLPQNATIITDEISFSVSGLRPIVENIDNIIASVDLRNMAWPPGRHEIPFDLNLPERTMVSMIPNLVIFISDPNNEDVDYTDDNDLGEIDEDYDEDDEEYTEEDEEEEDDYS